MKLQGMFAAITTPFDYKGDLYPAKVQHNVEKWNKTSLAGYVVCGAAGEGVLLSSEEKVRMWEMVARHAAPDRLLIADASVEGVRETVALANRAAGFGYKAALCGPPRHYPESWMPYYGAVADQSEIPVIVHNPGIARERIAELEQHPNIAGLLESGAAPVRAARKDFQWLTGSASGVWEALQMGASGAMLAFASAAPYATIAIWEAFRTREEDAGLDWQARAAHPSELVTSVPALKYAMDLNGYYGGPPRLPLSVPDAATKREIEEAFRDLKG